MQRCIHVAPVQHATPCLPTIKDPVNVCVYRIGKLESNTTCLCQGKLHMHAAVFDFRWGAGAAAVTQALKQCYKHLPLETSTELCMTNPCSLASGGTL